MLVLGLMLLCAIGVGVACCVHASRKKKGGESYSSVGESYSSVVLCIYESYGTLCSVCTLCACVCVCVCVVFLVQ